MLENPSTNQKNMYGRFCDLLFIIMSLPIYNIKIYEEYNFI